MVPVSTLEDVVPGVIASTARCRSILAMQIAEQRHHIEHAILEEAQAYTRREGRAMLAPVIVSVARKL